MDVFSWEKGENEDYSCSRSERERERLKMKRKKQLLMVENIVGEKLETKMKQNCGLIDHF